MSLVNLLYFRYVPDTVRIKVSQALRPARAAIGRKQPKLSVIVPVYNVEGYVEETLASLRRQQLVDMEIVVVNDGSTDDSLSVVEACQKLDPRIIIFNQKNAGLGAARNTGIRNATGKYLTFIDSDDIIPTYAYEYMISTLERTGSDFSVGRTVRFDSNRYWLPDFSIKAHDRERLATTIHEFPEAMFDILACNRVYLREFWNREIGEFPEGMVYEDHAPSTDAYLRAGTFDILDRTTYDWREREDQSSITQQNYLLTNLQNRIHASDLAQQHIEAFGDREVLAAWSGRVIAMGFTEYISFAVDGTDEYREVLQNWINQIYKLAPEEAFNYATPSQKTYSYFAAQGEWEKAREIRADFDRLEHRPPTKIIDGALYADRDALQCAAAAEVPDHFLRMSVFEARAYLWLDRVNWNGVGDLEVEGWANIRFADSSAGEMQIDAWLVDEDGRRVLQGHVERRESDRPNFISGYGHADHTGTYFTTTFTSTELEAGLRGGAALSLVADVRLDSLVGHADIGLWAHGSSSAMEIWPAPEGNIKVYRSAGRGLLVTNKRAEREHEEMLTTQVGRLRRQLSTKRSEVQSLVSEGSTVTLEFTSSAPKNEALSARLRYEHNDKPMGSQQVEHLGGRRYRLVADLIEAPFGLSPQTIAPTSGKVTFEGSDAEFRIGRDLLAQLPITQTTDFYDVSVYANGFHKFAFGLGLPGRMEYFAPVEVERLRAEHRARPDEVEEGLVLMQCYLGETFTDSQLELTKYLVANRPDLKLFAGVAHPGVRLPDGITPLVMGTAEWYDKINRAEFLVHNIDFPNWFERRPKQKYLQTFHGHPFKLMGKQYWEQAFNGDEAKVEKQLERRRETWTHMLISSEVGNQMYLDAYPDVATHVFEGLPRDDALTNGVTRELSEIRAGLGIPENAHVIMFAPTWRDYLATSDWTAHTFLEFDPEALVEKLGDDVYLLLRGHNFNARQGEEDRTSSRVIDVTDYPEINDLVIVSDAAILDYSSLRFDYAVTKKPMVFFVPDEDLYFEGRPGLLPYRETTPGAIVKSEEELIEALRSARQDPTPHAELEAFNARFNPLADGRASERVAQAFFGEARA